MVVFAGVGFAAHDNLNVTEKTRSSKCTGVIEYDMCDSTQHLKL